MRDIQHLVEKHQKDMELLEQRRRTSDAIRTQKLRELERLMQEALATQQHLLEQERSAA